jgi:hypothetical protein
MGFFDKLSGAAGALGKVGSFVGSASPLISLGLGIGQAIKGAKDAKRQNQAKWDLINNRQKLTNITEGMRVSTLGAEMQTQEAQRRFATSVDALQSAGVRGLVGGLGQQEQMQQRLQQGISADLDRQQAQIEQMRAQDEGVIRGMKESREEFKIGALAGEEAAARQKQAAGFKTIGESFKSMMPQPESPQSGNLDFLRALGDIKDPETIKAFIAAMQSQKPQ